jgi:hypothetical protein
MAILINVFSFPLFGTELRAAFASGDLASCNMRSKSERPFPPARILGPYSINFAYPTFSGRRFRPNVMWDFGISGSVGSYLQPEAAPTLPRQSTGDYHQILIGHDVTSRGIISSFGRVFGTRFISKCHKC